MNNKTRTIGFSAMLGMVLGLAACHTVEGAGKDIQEVGEEIEETAEETRN
jgi:predicted small secreted protein